MAPQNVLITAAGGHIGQELVPLLLQDSYLKLILPTTNEAHLRSSLPDDNNKIVVEEGNISDPKWFQSILTSHQVDTVFLCLTGTDELFTTMNALNSIARSGTVKYLIYLSGCAEFVSPEGIVNLMQVCDAAHVIVKALIELKLKYGNYPFTWTILGPTLFFINDLRSKRNLLTRGLFDKPLGEMGVSRVAPSDIALATRNAIFDQGERFGSRKIMIGSRHAYTGAEITSLWSEALGRDITMTAPTDEGLSQLEDHMGAHMPGSDAKAWARDLSLMYKMFSKGRFGMSDEQYAEQVQLLGKEAENYSEWVRKTAACWKSS